MGYQDYLLEDPARIYFCIFREMAHLAAWDQQGRFDYYFGPKEMFDEDAFLENLVNKRKPAKQRARDLIQSAARTLMEKGVEFASKVARPLFTEKGRDPKIL